MQSILRHKKQIVVVVLLVLSFFLLMDLNTRLSVLFRLSHTYDEMKTNIYDLESTKQLLLTQIAFATSDEAVQQFANNDRKWYQENDVPVFPIQDPNATPPASVQPTPTPLTVDHWEKWWALFFGD
jgi:hypothetical protein